jgi:hypothetical protein
MASDHDQKIQNGAGAGAGIGADAGTLGVAARRRSPRRTAHTTPVRPRVEVSFNELTGTMSWRTLGQPPRGTRQQHGTDTGALHPRTSPEAPWSARAAALRSAGPAPSRAPAKGAAPIPAHPAAVRAALSVDLASLDPEGVRRHLARVGTLRSQVTADLTHGTRVPTAVASRLRSTTATPAHAHALTAHRATTVVTRPPTLTTQPGPAAGPRR